MSIKLPFVLLIASCMIACEAADLPMSSTAPSDRGGAALDAIASEPASLSGSYVDLTISTPRVLTGNLAVSGQLRITGDGSLDVSNYTATIGRMSVAGELIMHSASGTVRAKSLRFTNPGSGNYNDPSLLSAGSIRLTGRYDIGGIPSSSGTHILYVAGTGTKTLTAGTIANLVVSNRGVTTAGQPVHVLGTLKLQAGELTGSEVQVDGPLRTLAGTTISNDTIVVGGILSSAGAFKPQLTVFTANRDFEIPGGSAYQYRDLEFRDQIRAEFYGVPFSGIRNVLIGSSATLDLANRSITFIGDLTVDGTLRLNSGRLTTKTITISPSSPNYAAGNRLTFGTVVLTGTGFVGGLIKGSGLEITGIGSVTVRSGQYRSVWISNPDTTMFENIVVEDMWFRAPGVVKGEGTVYFINTAAGSEMRFSRIHLTGYVQGSGLFAPTHAHLVNFVQNLSMSLTPSNYAWENLYLEAGTTLKLDADMSVPGVVTIDPASNLSLNGYELTASSLSSTGTLIMRTTSVLEVGEVSLEGQNATDSTLITAGKIRILGDSSRISRSSGNSRVIMAGTAPQFLDADNLAGLTIENPTTVSTVVDRVKGPAVLNTGHWLPNTALAPHLMGRLILLQNTTLETNDSPVYYGTLDDRGATILGVQPQPMCAYDSTCPGTP
jgi:hypothetical protein